jgi:predicted DNA-binding protein (MmcQ/YjbR family)
MLEKDIFNRYIPNIKKLLNYGFKYNNGLYIYEQYIINNSFLIIITINALNINGIIYDIDSECEYNMFRFVDNCGGFAGKVRNEYSNILFDIRDNCFDLKMFVSNQANRIGNMIKEKYSDLPFYEWDSTPDTGVFKHSQTKKWYAIIMNVSRSKLSIGDDKVDVINVKLNPDKIADLLKIDGYYPAYHMNKKYWISIILDETIDDDKIFNLLMESYTYASCKK